MAYSTFQAVTGPTGPEGTKAVGLTGPTGNIGVTGSTGPNANYLLNYEYPVQDIDGNDKVSLTFTNTDNITTTLFVDGLTGDNAYGTGTADGDTYTNTPSSFKGVSASATTGVTFQFRGITATNDLSLTVSATELGISGSAGVTTGYIDSGVTGQLLYLSPRYKGNATVGMTYGPSADIVSGAGNSVEVKFRNILESVGTEFNIDWCDSPFNVDAAGDTLREYILDVSNLLKYKAGNSGIKEGTICITFYHLSAADRIVMLRTKVNDSSQTNKLKLPLYGASEVNFADPISGNVLFTNEGYGNDSYRRDIDDFNTPYDNPIENYEAGPHPQTWSGNAGSEPLSCPTEEAIIFDTNCSSDSNLNGAVFRGQEFITLGRPVDELEGGNVHSYCIRIDDRMVETQNQNDPWYNKLRLVIMPGCRSAGNATRYGFILSCGNECQSNENYNGSCYYPPEERNNRENTSEGLSGRFSLDVTNSNNISLSAPFDITNITYDYISPGLSLDSDDGIDYTSQKNVTLVISGGPNNIKFPNNVLFDKTPVFTNGVDIVNILTIDNGNTWYATQTGYGWDVDIFAGDELGSCCSNLGCIDFTSESYCNNIDGVFQERVSCSNRTEEVCGAGVLGACCTGVIDQSGEPIYCPPQNAATICEEARSGEYGELETPPDPTGNAYDAIICNEYKCFQCCDNSTPDANYCDGICNTGIRSCCVPLSSGPDPEEGCFQFTESCSGMCESLNFGFGYGTHPETNSCGDCNRGVIGTCCSPCPIGCSNRTEAECNAIIGSNWIPTLDSCNSCTIYEETEPTLGTPKCIPDQTLLQCNLINGVFISATEDNPDPCAAPDNGTWPNGCAYNACEGPVLGSCCDKINGTCYGIMRETQCSAIGGPNSNWTEDGTCDDCCEDKVVRGACCLCNNSCRGDTIEQQVTPQECSALGGIFMGIDTLCGDVNCAIAGSCDCACESPGCCDCPAGHPSRSPCCDDPSGPACCSPGDDCCQSSDPCCDSSNPECDQCFTEDCDEGNDGVDDTVGFNFGGTNSGNNLSGGNIDNKGDKIHGSCCVGYRCKSQISYANNNVKPEEECFGQYKEGIDCASRECQTQKFNGACCCVTYFLDCSNEDENLSDCSSCEVRESDISCTNCGFDGNISGFSMPVNGTSGPYRPLPLGYSSPNPLHLYNPPATGDKRRITDPNPIITPDGNVIPYSWTDCCKSPGGCSPKPCTLANRTDIAGITMRDASGCPSGCNTPPNQNPCSDECAGTPAAEMANLCGYCNGEICDGICCPTIVSGNYKQLLENASERSQCEGCDCGIQLCPTCANDKCESRIFSSCQFVYDKSNLVDYAPADSSAGEEFVWGTSCSGKTGPIRDGNFMRGSAGSICSRRKDEIWPTKLKDNENPDWDIDNPFDSVNPFNREASQNTNSSNQFRKINKSVDIQQQVLNNTSTFRYVQR